MIMVQTITEHMPSIANMQKTNLKRNEGKSYISCTGTPVHGKIMSIDGVRPDSYKLKTLTKYHNTIQNITERNAGLFRSHEL